MQGFPQPLFHAEAHEVLTSYDANHLVLAVHHGQVTKAESSEYNVGSVEGELGRNTDR